jgi:hypothetical protein
MVGSHNLGALKLNNALMCSFAGHFAFARGTWDQLLCCRLAIPDLQRHQQRKRSPPLCIPLPGALHRPFGFLRGLHPIALGDPQKSLSLALHNASSKPLRRLSRHSVHALLDCILVWNEPDKTLLLSHSIRIPIRDRIS